MFRANRTLASCSAAVLMLAMLLVDGTAAGATGRSGSLVPPSSPQYTLALGDSLAFGYQRDRLMQDLVTGEYSPDDYPGYVVPLSQMVKTASRRHRPVVVNYSCPGETTASMISGGCPFPDAVAQTPYGYERVLHDDYAGAQLDAAAAFLASHRGKVSPITVSVGANDLLGLVSSCSNQLPCVWAGLDPLLSQLSTNLTTVLRRLRAADPRAEILVLSLYNPLALAVPGSDPIPLIANAMIERIARSVRATVADGYAAINLAPTTNPAGPVCEFTLMCAAGTQPDIHPSDAGYLRLAGAFLAASRRSR